MARPALAALRRSSVRHNLALARRQAGDALLYGVVKADAYGHGLGAVAAELAAGGIDGLAVACLEEALVLREQLPDLPVLLLEGAVDAMELEQAVAQGLDLTVHCEEQLQALLGCREARLGRVWLKHDSGMHRLGMDHADCVRAWQALAPRLGTARLGLMTHLATADEPGHALNVAQLQAFRALCAALEPDERSLCNSAALLSGMTADTTWVRPGLMLYGVSPFSGTAPAVVRELRPVMELRSAVIGVTRVRAGQTVGYGGAWLAPYDACIAVVAMGYGDGYPRHAPSGTPVLVNGQRAALAGRVSMDLLSVDVTALDGVRRGDPVVLWGDGLPVEEVAHACGTIAYELLCRLTPRVRREWMD